MEYGKTIAKGRSLEKKKTKKKKDSITIEARKKIKIVKNPDVQKGVIQVHPEDFDDIVRIVKVSLGQYLSFYKTSGKNT